MSLINAGLGKKVNFSELNESEKTNYFESLKNLFKEDASIPKNRNCVPLDEVFNKDQP